MIIKKIHKKRNKFFTDRISKSNKPATRQSSLFLKQNVKENKNFVRDR